AGKEPALGDPRGPGSLAQSGPGGCGRSHSGRDLRWTTEPAQGGCRGPARCAPPTLSVPLPARSRQARLRSRPARQEGTQEACPWCATDREGSGRSQRRGSQGGSRLLPGGAQCPHRRWTPSPGRFRAETAGASGGHPCFPLTSVRKRGACKELERLKAILARGLAETAPLWPDIRTAYGFVHRAARILGNEEGNGASYVRRDYRQLLGQMLAHRDETPFLHQAFCQFVKVSKSYWSGLFACYEQPDLPRTNNDLEQYF